MVTAADRLVAMRMSRIHVGSGTIIKLTTRITRAARPMSALGSPRRPVESLPRRATSVESLHRGDGPSIRIPRGLLRESQTLMRTEAHGIGLFFVVHLAKVELWKHALMEN